MQALTTRLGHPVRDKDDWSIALPRKCPCQLCGILADFLAAPTQTRFEWPLAKDHRAHIHGVLDSHALPVSHVTRRAGRPHTLVLVKTEALFTGEAAERHVWERDLRWLAKTTGAFSR